MAVADAGYKFLYVDVGATSLPGDTRTIGGVSMSWFVVQGDKPSCPSLLSAAPGVKATDDKFVKSRLVVSQL